MCMDSKLHMFMVHAMQLLRHTRPCLSSKSIQRCPSACTCIPSYDTAQGHMQGAVSKPGIHAGQLCIHPLPEPPDQSADLRGCLDMPLFQRQPECQSHSKVIPFSTSHTVSAFHKQYTRHTRSSATLVLHDAPDTKLLSDYFSQ